MKYCGYGTFEMEPWEDYEMNSFYDDPERWLWENDIFKSYQDRKEYWWEWFSQLKDLPKNNRSTWKDYLIDVFEERVISYVCEPADMPFGEAGRLGQN